MTNRRLYDEPRTGAISRLAALLGAVSLLALAATGRCITPAWSGWRARSSR
jgi:hypothetical protein